MSALMKMKNISGQQTCRFVGNNFTEENRNTDENMLKFPSTKNILWDHTSVGADSLISISYYRKPRLCISEKVLRFAHRHIESKGKTFCGCALVGQLSIDDDGEGLTFTLDRFDPGGDSLNNSYSLTPGDLAVPFQVMLNSKNDRQSSSDDYLQALQLLKQRCCSKNSIDLSNFLLTKGWCSIYTSGDQCVHHLQFDVVTMATEFKAIQINAVPIVPTALSKNLSGPMSMSHLQGEPKTGYLTMDHTRKVLLVLESDPKVANLPLVGIWVSGVSFVYSPYIWACCLRYLHNASLNDRVCVPPESFLLVLYNPMHSKPEFYELVTSTGSGQMNFDLFNGYEVINLPKTMTSGNQTIEMDIGAVDGGQKKEKFDGAIHLLKSQKSTRQEDVPVSSAVSVPDEMTPRNMPAPHKSQLPVMTSMVPEVSLLFGEDSGICVNPKKPTITQGKANGVAHMTDFTRSKLAPNLPVLHEQPTVQHSNSASGFNAQQNVHQQTNFHSGRLAKHYMNSVPKPDNSVQTSNQGHGIQSRTSHLDSLTEKRTSNSNPFNQNVDPMFQNRNSNMDPRFQNPNFMYQNMSSQQNNTHNRTEMNSMQRMLPQTVPGQVFQPYPQYVTPNYPSVPYGQPSHGYVPTQGMMGPPPPQQIPTQPQMPYPSQQGVPQVYRPIGQQYVNNQQGMNTNVYQTAPNTQHKFVPITSQNQQIDVGNSVQRNVHQDQRPSPHADSSKSSDDSGLSVTPEKQIPPPRPSSKNSATIEEEPDSVLQSKNINWNQVPPEVYQLLIQQDAQLKKLQSQIQMLITNQSNSSQNTTTTELDTQVTSVNKTNSTHNNSKAEMCSVAVNTTAFSPDKVASCQSVSLQTSPQKPMSSRSSESSGNHTPRQGSQCSGDDGRTPAEIRHRGILPFNSTHKDEFDLDASQDLSSVVNNMALHDKTIDSIQSDMIVDMPSYHSSPTRSEKSGDTLCNSQDTLSNSIDKSPTSASMCGRQDEEDSGDEQDPVDTNDKEYYDRLMNNIQVLLHQQDSESPLGDQTDTLQNDTLQQSIMLGQYINSIQHRSGNASRTPLETTFIPKINYMSMMFDSDSDCSMEINAMAMKYLKDEQLTQMTKLQTKAKLGGNNNHQRVAMLRHILSDDKEATPNVTTMGMSPNDMTFATRKYMEKHGLINGDSRNTTADSTENDSYQLQLNFSTITGRSESPVQLTQDVIHNTGNDSYKTPTRQTVSSRLVGSPLIDSQNVTNTPSGNRNRTASVNSGNMTNKTNSPFVVSKTNSPFGNSQAKYSVPNSQTNSPFMNRQTNSPYNNSHQKTSEKLGRMNYHFTPSPGMQGSPHMTKERPNMLEDRQDVFDHRGPAENQMDHHRQENQYKHLYTDDVDKILDITRLRMLPKLL
ncbi:SCL-interrupting locus protein [Mytilus galloprovincialis]|uniref:SCL-interrupting locus protein n=1 Tax=Mytilus galloprovincialis TaxID=29158 RepID=A0A8B6DK77_MYTGA|nr:SCL-interrupting locus protein [Mytilus galloprovincialis]